MNKGLEIPRVYHVRQGEKSLLIIKRFHDVGRGIGYFLFCLLLTPIGVGAVLILLEVLKDSDTDNQWGEWGKIVVRKKQRLLWKISFCGFLIFNSIWCRMYVNIVGLGDNHVFNSANSMLFFILAPLNFKWKRRNICDLFV